MTMRQQGVFRLAIATIVIVGVWMVILPRLSDLPSVRQRIDSNRTAGINPTAVFYTDHPGMMDIERSIQARVDAPSGWFWKPSR